MIDDGVQKFTEIINGVCEEICKKMKPVIDLFNSMRVNPKIRKHILGRKKYLKRVKNRNTLLCKKLKKGKLKKKYRNIKI